MGTEYKMSGIRVERETTNPETRRTERHDPRASLLLWVGKTSRPVSIPLDLAALIKLNGQIASAIATLTETDLR